MAFTTGYTQWTDLSATRFGVTFTGESLLSKPEKNQFVYNNTAHAVMWNGSGWFIYRFNRLTYRFDTIVSENLNSDADAHPDVKIVTEPTSAAVNYVYIAWASETQNFLTRHQLTGGIWQDSVNINFDGAHAEATVSMAIDELTSAFPILIIAWVEDDGADNSVHYSVYKEATGWIVEDVTLVSGLGGATMEQLSAVSFNDGTASIGIAVSDQATPEMAFYHHHNADSYASSANWQTKESAATGTTIADNHGDVFVCGTSGELGLVWKDSVATPNINYTRRNSSGVWATPGVVTSGAVTRPRGVWDPDNSEVWVFAKTGGSILNGYKWADTAVPSSPTAIKTIEDDTNTIDDVSVPAFGVTDESGLCVMGYDKDDDIVAFRFMIEPLDIDSTSNARAAATAKLTAMGVTHRWMMTSSTSTETDTVGATNGTLVNSPRQGIRISDTRIADVCTRFYYDDTHAMTTAATFPASGVLTNPWFSVWIMMHPWDAATANNGGNMWVIESKQSSTKFWALVVGDDAADGYAGLYCNGANGKSVLQGPEIADGTWHHVVINQTGDITTGRMWVDGVLYSYGDGLTEVGGGDAADIMPTSSANVTVSGKNVGATKNIDAFLYDISMGSQELTTEQVLAYYNASVGISEKGPRTRPPTGSIRRLYQVNR